MLNVIRNDSFSVGYTNRQLIQLLERKGMEAQYFLDLIEKDPSN